MCRVYAEITNIMKRTTDCNNSARLVQFFSPLIIAVIHGTIAACQSADITETLDFDCYDTPK